MDKVKNFYQGAVVVQKSPKNKSFQFSVLARICSRKNYFVNIVSSTVLISALSIPFAFADTLTWERDNDVESNKWNDRTHFAYVTTATNWTGGELLDLSRPNNGDSLRFGLGGSFSENDFTDIDLHTIYFDNFHHIIGNQIDLKSGGVIGAGRIETALSLQGNDTITFDVSGTSSVLTLDSKITDSVLYGNTPSAPSFRKTGSGILYLGGNNGDMNGDIEINGGTIRLGYDANALSNNTTVNIVQGVLDFNSTAEDFGGLTGSGYIDLTRASMGIGMNDTSSTYNGSILTRNGASGTLNIKDGSFSLGQDAFIQNTISVDVSSTATFGLFNTGASIKTLTGSGNVLIGNKTLSVGNGNGSSVFSGQISGSGGVLTKVGLGTLALTGVNSYSGATNINGGTLQISNSNNLGTARVNFNGGALQTSGNFELNRSIGLVGDGNINVTSGTLVLNSSISGNGTLTKTGAGNLYLSDQNGSNNYSNTGDIHINQGLLGQFNDNVLNDHIMLNINAGATYFLNGKTETISGFVGSGNVDLSNATDYGRLTIGANNSWNLQGFEGNITGNGSLTKIGTGEHVLSGENTFSGETRILNGTLSFLGSNVSSGQSAITMSNDALLRVQGDNRVLYIRGQGNVNIVNGNITITGNYSEYNSYDGIIAGTGGLIKEGNSTQALYGLNTYSGGTTINGGTLIGNANSLQGWIINNASLVLQGGGNYSSKVSGSGQVTKTEGGTASLTSTANSYTGVTNIQSGTLAFQGEGTSSSNSGVNITNNASLDVNGDNTVKYLSSTNGNTGNGGSVILSSGSLTIGDGSHANFYGAISGTGNLIKTGSGTQTLSGVNTYTGNTTVSNGILHLASSGLIDNAGVFTQSGGQTIIDGTLGQDTISIQDGELVVNGTLNSRGMLTNAAMLSIESGGSLVNTGTVNNHTSGLIKVNTSTLLAGTLVNNGSIEIAVNEILTLTGDISGSGSFSGSTFLDGASINPGNSPGTLTLDDSTWNDVDLTIEIGQEVGGGLDFDRIEILGDLILLSSFTIDFDFLDGVNIDNLIGETFNYLTIMGSVFDGNDCDISGSCTEITNFTDYVSILLDGWAADWIDDGQGGFRLDLSYLGKIENPTDVPEPYTILLTLLGCAILLTRKRQLD